MKTFVAIIAFSLFVSNVYADFSGKWSAKGTIDETECNSPEISINVDAQTLLIEEFNLYCGQTAMKHFETIFERKGNELYFQNEKVGNINENSFFVEFTGMDEDLGTEVDVHFSGKLNNNGTFSYRETYVVQGDILFDLNLLMNRL